MIGVAVAQSWFETRPEDATARCITVAAGGGMVRGTVVRDSYFAGNNAAEAAVECADDGAELTVLQNAFTGFKRAGVLAGRGASGVRVDGFGASAWYSARTTLPVLVKE